jgi:hypothetical protein
MRSVILEVEARSTGERPRHLRDEDLVRARGGHDPRRLVDGDAAETVPDELDLAHVDARADPKAVITGGSPDRDRAVEGETRPVEARE